MVATNFCRSHIVPSVLFLVTFFFCDRPCLVSAGDVVINASGQVVVEEEEHQDRNHQQQQPHSDKDEDDDDDDEHAYYEFTDIDDYPYYPEEFKDHDYGDEWGMLAVTNKMKKMNVVPGHFILDDFVVGGVNLAKYEMDHPPFRLYNDFDIQSYIMDADDGLTSRLRWKELISIRNKLQRPSLSWYVDKVARKRWIAQQKQYPQPRLYFVQYKDELTETGKKEDEWTAILANLPTEHGFCAKPTHMSMTMGNWLVDIVPKLANGEVEEENGAKFTRRAQRLNNDENFDPEECADSLAEGLQREASGIESWALKNVRPGIVIEELFSNHEDRSLPPHEFCLFVIWGKVYIGQWNQVGDDRFLSGFFYRDGSSAPACPMSELPDWIPWDELVGIAEGLSQHKDMFRVDMFVGVPRYSQDSAKLRIVVSESEIHPTTMFCNPFIAEEMARLWIAGYKIGNYELIPNDEVPSDYVVKKTTPPLAALKIKQDLVK
ncbi:hypothetical protein FRACYDRAFT_240627 [Fragilariopsis cylindrus CCMP1102]|uniref:Uncharacterized protein n=1 Tax=Fragilariopsis cylindrus CCMP1102 TaxID=635003 RepID=A0A1E7FCL9_9STRA|nr:hypothetical protein FRACYDRAFT_240627 [Fragilariopsis cylindrus CCMP1102]|eukprot:OEU15932.1 hypothetical protein FRACYDRAFT_240627 [Fragilariopsis cylindrus CCMP1102]